MTAPLHLVVTEDVVTPEQWCSVHADKGFTLPESSTRVTWVFTDYHEVLDALRRHPSYCGRSPAAHPSPVAASDGVPAVGGQDPASCAARGLHPRADVSPPTAGEPAAPTKARPQSRPNATTAS